MLQQRRARVQVGVTGEGNSSFSGQRRSHSVSAPRFSAIKLDQTGMQWRQRLNFTVPSCTVLHVSLRVRSDCDQDGRPCDQAAMRLWASRSHCGHDSAWLSFCARFPRIWRRSSKIPESFSYAALFKNLPLTISGGSPRTVEAWKSGEKGHDQLHARWFGLASLHILHVRWSCRGSRAFGTNFHFLSVFVFSEKNSWSRAKTNSKGVHRQT